MWNRKMSRLAVMALVVFAAGCSLPQHRDRCQNQGLHGSGVGCGCGFCGHQNPVGTVQTGGQFARATTLPISSRGLSLSTAVDETLRQGVRSSGVVSAPQVFTNKSVVELAIPEIVAAKTKVADLVEDLAGEPENDQLAEYLSQAEESLPRSLADSLDEKLANAPEGEPSVWNELSVADRDEVSRHLIAMRAQQIYQAVYQDQVANLPGVDEVIVEKISAQIRGLIRDFGRGSIVDTEINGESLKRITDAVGASLEVDSPVKNSTFVSHGETLYYQIAVALSRRGGETLVFPLWLVEMYQAGDIALRDGDSIQLLHYNRTELFSHSRGLQELSDSIATGASDLDGYIDILRVTCLGDNGLEQHFVPRNTHVAFGPDRGFGFVLENAKVPENATIQPDILDLVGVIRRGRSEAIRRSADALQVKTRLQRLEEQHKLVRQKISQLPVIGDACQVVESTTGFDSADAFATARDGVGSAVGFLR
jgi:hypothetical protein